MELKWDDAPVTGPVVFSRDVFEKFTLAPTIKEIYALLQSSDVKPEEAGEKKPDGPSAKVKTVKCDEDSAVRSTPASDEATSECETSQNHVNAKPVKTAESPAFPDPLLPYPGFTTINANQRRSYLGILSGKPVRYSKPLIERVRNEVTEFMKYLQDVSRACADRYNYTPAGSTRYSEEYFTACLEHVKSYPQFYSIQEITSLTNVKFVCEISLNFEKQLLAMGKIDMLEKKVIPEDFQLAVDYETVSNVVPPAKKATSAHTAISSDVNAEKLSATYEPQVCLSKEAFLQLLNNSSEFTEAWELPIWVKTNPMNGSSQSKTAYIDSPLLKTEMSWRERSLLFHEESMKLAFKKTVSRPVFFLTSEELSFDMNPPPEDKISRNVVGFDEVGMDFETDLTDLESFGESYKPSKKVKEQNEPKTACTNPSQLTLSPKKQTDSIGTSKHTSAPQNTPPEPIELITAEKQGETNPSLVDGGNGAMDESAVSEKESASEDSKVSSVKCPPTKRPRQIMEDKLDHNSDSDEERLVIDHIVSPQRPTQVTPGETSSLQAPDSTTPSPTNPLGKGAKKGIKRPRISSECDQLGQILRMQNAMLKSTPSKNQEAVKPPVPEDKPPEPKTHSLVKQCVTSYLESREGQGQGEDTTLPAAVPVLVVPQRKRLLREDLQVSAEDEMDYDPPAEGSVLYKLYSLLDILLMVRSSVDVAHPRHDKETFRAVPVHVLPKLEYQLCYGAESLTHAEACQLWAEKLLHSSTVSFISRINAHTSEVVQVQNVPDDWIQHNTCDFKPTRCLNTLYHLLKKVSALQEGRYLLVHKPREGFVTIFKASNETKAARCLYHLQDVHCGPPAVSPGVPWVPLDPLHVMPFHQKHNRPPCTFPPRPPPPAKVGTGPKQRQGKNAVRPPRATSTSKTANLNQSPKKKNKKGARKTQGWMGNMRVKLIKDLQKSQTSEGEKTPS